MKEWDNDKHEEALERRRWKKFDAFKNAVKQGKTDDNGKVITITEKAVRKDEDSSGGFVNLLNEEIAQLQKGLQIDLMVEYMFDYARTLVDIKTATEDSKFINTYKETLKGYANFLYLVGYRKIDKDKEVVLSREEYDKLQDLLTKRQNVIDSYRKCIDKRNSAIKQARKETAEKILSAVFKHITNIEVWGKLQENTWLSKGGNFIANKHIWDLLLEPIAKQFGVDIGGDPK